MDRWNPLRGVLLRSPVYYGWFVVASCFLLTLLTFGTIYSYTVFFGPILAEFGGTHASTSVLFSLQTFVTFCGAAVLGFGIDKYGIRPALVVAGTLLAVGFVGASRPPGFAALVFFYSGPVALGLGIVYVVAYTTPPRWFEERPGLATGVAVSGTGVGILAVPPLTELFIQQVGWRQAYLLLGGLFLTGIAISLLIVLDHPDDLEESVPRDPDDPLDSPPSVSATEQISHAMSDIRTRLFILVFLALLLAFAPSYAVSVYLVEFAQSIDISRGVGVAAVSAFGATSVVIKFIAGWIADRVGIARTMAGFAATMTLSIPLLLSISTPVGVLVFAGLLGIGYGGVDALLTPLLAALFGTENLSSLFGALALGFAITGVTVPYAVGAGFDQFGAFDLPFLAAAVIGGCATAVLLVLSRIEQRLPEDPLTHESIEEEMELPTGE